MSVECYSPCRDIMASTVTSADNFVYSCEEPLACFLEIESVERNEINGREHQ